MGTLNGEIVFLKKGGVGPLPGELPDRTIEVGRTVPPEERREALSQIPRIRAENGVIDYHAENHQVAFYELGVILGSPADPIAYPKLSLVLLSLEVRPCRVADLCEESERKLLEVSFRELTGNWRNSPDQDIPTHVLGRALFRARGLEGFLFPSSKPSGGKNLVVFPDKMNHDLSGWTEYLT